MRVAIAGAGAVGRSIARELVRGDHHVMLLERKLEHVDPDAIPEAAGRLDAFVAAGLHGQMGWMAERMEWRGNPAAHPPCNRGRLT